MPDKTLAVVYTRALPTRSRRRSELISARLRREGELSPAVVKDDRPWTRRGLREAIRVAGLGSATTTSTGHAPPGGAADVVVADRDYRMLRHSGVPYEVVSVSLRGAYGPLDLLGDLVSVLLP